MGEAQQQAFTGCLYEHNGIWYMRAYFYDGDKRKTKGKSTKLPIKGNKKRAQAMLNDWLEELATEDTSFMDMGFFEFLMECWNPTSTPSKTTPTLATRTS
ncbi:MAG: hypothetical protein FWC27_07765 [Firmicutes bacterium]|nr:hypothetical protein [Bacillota bacterium]